MAYQRGRDVYVHFTNRSAHVYYIHRWSVAKKESEQLIPISPRDAERFVESKGYLMHSPDERDEKARETLMRYAYGLIEEF
jgi:hypothetical protein